LRDVRLDFLREYSDDCFGLRDVRLDLLREYSDDCFGLRDVRLDLLWEYSDNCFGLRDVRLDLLWEYSDDCFGFQENVVRFPFEKLLTEQGSFYDIGAVKLFSESVSTTHLRNIK
jgi:hypothetical protein